MKREQGRGCDKTRTVPLFTMVEQKNKRWVSLVQVTVKTHFSSLFDICCDCGLFSPVKRPIACAEELQLTAQRLLPFGICTLDACILKEPGPSGMPGRQSHKYSDEGSSKDVSADHARQVGWSIAAWAIQPH